MVLVTGKQENVVLADQLMSLDWRARHARHKGAVRAEELAAVRAKLWALIGGVQLVVRLLMRRCG